MKECEGTDPARTDGVSVWIYIGSYQLFHPFMDDEINLTKYVGRHIDKFYILKQEVFL
jgi:hypothetical protein